MRKREESIEGPIAPVRANQPECVDMWMVEDAIDGTISMGKSHKGDVPERISITMNGRSIYRLQQFLQAQASLGGNYYRVRAMVYLAEELRIAMVDAVEVKP